MLVALGWDVGDPAEVITETSADFDDFVPRRADYVLKDVRSGEIVMIVEAKALGGSLADAIRQMAGYCVVAGSEHGVVTDGNDWILLEVHEDDADDEVEAPEISTNQIARFSVCDGDAVTNAVIAQQFTNKAKVSFDELQRHWTDMSRVFISTDGGSSAEVSQPAPTQTRTLASLRDMQVPRVPSCLIFPEGYGIRVPDPEWRDWAVQVAIYLYVWSAAYLEEYDDYPLPVYFPRSRQLYIVNDRPKHPNKDDFEEWFRVTEDVYVELDFGRRSGSEIVLCDAGTWRS